MSIHSIMIGKKKAVHWLIWVVERIKKRGNWCQSIPHSQFYSKQKTLCVCKSSSLEMHGTMRQFLSLGGFTRVILNCSSLGVGMLPPTLGTKVLSVCTWLTKFTFWWIEMAAVCTDRVASRGSYINSLDRSSAIIRNQRICWTDLLQMLIKGVLLPVHLWLRKMADSIVKEII